MMGTTCFWCGVDPRKEMPNGISPHSTWCPQYRMPKTPNPHDLIPPLIKDDTPPMYIKVK